MTGHQTRNGLTGQTIAYNARGAATQIGSTANTYHGQGNTDRLTAGTTAFNSGTLGLMQRTSGSTVHSYTRTPEGTPVGLRASNRSYYVQDHLGSVVGMFSSTGSYHGGYSYSPYGEARFTSTNATVTANNLRYIGEHHDGNGIYKLGVRYYDASLGRFTEMDPGTALLRKDGEMPRAARVTWREWLDTSPSGTTPLGLSLRLLCPALASLLIVGWNLAELDHGLANWPLVVIAATFYALAYVCPWLAERAGIQSPAVPRSLDTALFLPSVLATVGVTLIVAFTPWTPLAVSASGAQTALAVAPSSPPGGLSARIVPAVGHPAPLNNA